VSFSVQCCDRRRGLINNTLVCSACDYTAVSVIPNEGTARDVDPDVQEVSPVFLAVNGLGRTVGWIAELEALPELLEQVAAELRALRAERSDSDAAGA